MESESNQRFDRGSKSAESSSSKHSGPGCGSAPPSSSASTFVPPPSDALGKLGVIENTADVNQKKIASSLQENSTDIELAEYGGAEDDDSMDSQFTEGVDVPRRHLGYVQTTSLMLNATIGSGIFTTPGYVLALTRSKEICLILWAVGGIYSALAITIFLEYGTALPFNGMALIYVWL
ncbi:MAG: hypothetical protein M1822_007404 [Bathelium mastoideum]|nr:MAG: hypothetical protein M1822_007404 [Bathelium mastoideum]